MGLAELQSLSSAIKSAFSIIFVPPAADSHQVWGVLSGAAQFQPGLWDMKPTDCNTHPWGVLVVVLSLLFRELSKEKAN